MYALRVPLPLHLQLPVAAASGVFACPSGLDSRR